MYRTTQEKENVLHIGLDWAGVIANPIEAQRLVLMEMYGSIQNEQGEYLPLNGPYKDKESSIVPFSNQYRQVIDKIVTGRCPYFSYTKEWVLRDKSHLEEGTLLSISNEEREAMKVVLYEQPGYPENIPEIPGAVSSIKKLQDAGHVVTIVTSRGPKIPQLVVEKWLAAHDIEVSVRFGVKDKALHLKDFNVFVDDSPKHLAFGDLDLKTRRFLFLHFYNVDSMIGGKGVDIVGMWDTLLEKIKRLES